MMDATRLAVQNLRSSRNYRIRRRVVNRLAVQNLRSSRNGQALREYSLCRLAVQNLRSSRNYGDEFNRRPKD